MADLPTKKGSELPLAAEAKDGDVIFGIQDGVTKRTPAASLRAYVLSAISDEADPSKGASLVGWDGDTVGEQLDQSKKVASYAAARSYNGSASRVEITQSDVSGKFNRRPFMVGDVDTNGTMLVSTNGLWTLVRDYFGPPNPLWFGADKTGAVSSVAAFNAAMAVSGQVAVTKGSYLLDSATSDGTWLLDKGVAITGLPVVGKNSLMDLSRLTGRVMAFQAGGRIGFRLGDSDPWLERDIRNFSESLAEVVALSSQGSIGALFASRSSDNPVPNMSTIGAAFYGVNDNLVNPETSWSTYFEAVRFAGAGPAYNAEMDFVNLGNTYDFDPYSPQSAYGSTQAATVSLWMSCGGGDSGLAAGSQNISAAMVWLPNSKQFKRGIVVRNGSLETQEIIAAPSGYKYAWYSGAGTLNSYIDHRTIDQRTRIDSSLGNVWSSRKLRSTTSTAPLDVVHQHVFFGGTDSATYYTGGDFTVRQRTTFSASNARFSVDIRARNNDGTFSEISLNGVADKSFAPIADGVMAFGGSSNRWNNSYFAVAPTVTSDERSKQQFRQIADACLDAWASVEYQQYKLNDAVAMKGDAARWHFGVIAQRVKEAFEANGLDAFEYGLLCHDAWDEVPEIVDAWEDEFDDSGHLLRAAGSQVTQLFRVAEDRYGVRYEEALALEAALMRRTTQRLEARIAELEGRQ